MRQLEAIRGEKANFGNLLNVIQKVFEQIKDSRKANSKLSLRDIFSAALAIFSLKCPSLLTFEKKTKTESGNLKQLYNITHICSDTNMRTVLDEVDPKELHKGFKAFYGILKECKIDRDYNFIQGKKIIAVDGVEHFSSPKIHCKHCLEKKHRNGETTYHHQMLSAVMVHPDKREVFPIGCEPIIKADGDTKNDCERNAAKRLISYLKANYQEEDFLITEDALYSNGPHIKEFADSKFSFIVGIKPAGNQSLFNSYEARKRKGRLNTKTWQGNEEVCQLYFCNNLPLNTTNSKIRVNMLVCEKVNKKGNKSTFSWVTDLKITQANVVKIMKAGRARWKIENETFNTLKNQGYHFDHNFGHGNKHLCTVLAYLMFFAFLMDQIRQYADINFRKVWMEIGTKKKLWEMVKSAFTMKAFESMENLFVHIALEFDIGLENSA